MEMADTIALILVTDKTCCPGLTASRRSLFRFQEVGEHRTAGGQQRHSAPRHNVKRGRNIINTINPIKTSQLQETTATSGTITHPLQRNFDGTAQMRKAYLSISGNCRGQNNPCEARILKAQTVYPGI